jgi:hypothetical protein
MAEDPAAPAAPDAPPGHDAPAAEEARPADEQEAAVEADQGHDQQEAEQPAAEDPGDKDAAASEPVPSAGKAKKQAKPKQEQAREGAEEPNITSGSRERKKVEHYRPPDAPAGKTATSVQEVRLPSRLCCRPV